MLSVGLKTKVMDHFVSHKHCPFRSTIKEALLGHKCPITLLSLLGERLLLRRTQHDESHLYLPSIKKKVKARFMNFGLELLRDHVTVSFPKINELGNSSM